MCYYGISLCFPNSFRTYCHISMSPGTNIVLLYGNHLVMFNVAQSHTHYVNVWGGSDTWCDNEPSKMSSFCWGHISVRCVCVCVLCHLQVSTRGALGPAHGSQTQQHVSHQVFVKLWKLQTKWHVCSALSKMGFWLKPFLPRTEDLALSEFDIMHRNGWFVSKVVC